MPVMQVKRKARIAKSDHIVAVVARSAAGPGWANRPLWVVVKGQDGKLREECLQPNEQGHDIQLLYGIAERVHDVLVAAVERLIERKQGTKR